MTLNEAIEALKQLPPEKQAEAVAKIAQLGQGKVAAASPRRKLRTLSAETVRRMTGCVAIGGDAVEDLKAYRGDP